VDRKKLVARLFECGHCKLRFRHPRDEESTLSRFYQEQYSEPDGITTRLPDAAKNLAAGNDLLQLGEGARSAKRLIPCLTAITKRQEIKSLRLLDYGCSWGYMLQEFRALGCNVQGFEISQPRAAFGREQLCLEIVTDPSEVRKDNDIVVCSHVIEHVPDPRQLLNTLRALTLADGYVLLMCPNGSREMQASLPSIYRKMWGKVHPNMISSEFLLATLPDVPLLIATEITDLFGLAENWNGRSVLQADNMSGIELFAVIRGGNE